MTLNGGEWSARKEPPIPNNRQVGGSQEPVWMFSRTKEYLAHAGN